MSSFLPRITFQKPCGKAQGSIFTNKYSEGYPGKRYYGGQTYTDQVETIAIERAKQLFGASFANVQTHSGANANIAMYMALLQPGDTVLGMDLSHGGHLTHGHPVTYITKFFNFVRYKMKDPETGEIDYDDMRRVALEAKPKIVLAGFSAYSRELDYEKISAIAKEVGAYAVMDAAHIAGLIAGGVAKNPFDYGFDVITSTTHKTLRGPRGGLILTRESEEIAKKVDKAVFPGLQGGPLMHVIAGKAVAFGEALSPNFKVYAAQVLKNAKAMEEVFRAQNVRMLAAVQATTLSSQMCSVRSASPAKRRKFCSTGLESPSTRTLSPTTPEARWTHPVSASVRRPSPRAGVKEAESARVAQLMLDAMKNRADETKLDAIRQEIKDLAAKFPIPDSFV